MEVQYNGTVLKPVLVSLKHQTSMRHWKNKKMLYVEERTCYLLSFLFLWMMRMRRYDIPPDEITDRNECKDRGNCRDVENCCGQHSVHNIMKIHLDL
jgi:hypothetical protein